MKFTLISFPESIRKLPIVALENLKFVIVALVLDKLGIVPEDEFRFTTDTLPAVIPIEDTRVPILAFTETILLIVEFVALMLLVTRRLLVVTLLHTMLFIVPEFKNTFPKLPVAIFAKDVTSNVLVVIALLLILVIVALGVFIFDAKIEPNVFDPMFKFEMLVFVTVIFVIDDVETCRLLKVAPGDETSPVHITFPAVSERLVQFVKSAFEQDIEVCTFKNAVVALGANNEFIVANGTFIAPDMFIEPILA